MVVTDIVPLQTNQDPSTNICITDARSSIGGGKKRKNAMPSATSANKRCIAGSIPWLYFSRHQFMFKASFPYAGLTGVSGFDHSVGPSVLSLAVGCSSLAQFDGANILSGDFCCLCSVLLSHLCLHTHFVLAHNRNRIYFMEVMPRLRTTIECTLTLVRNCTISN